MDVFFGVKEGFLIHRTIVDPIDRKETIKLFIDPLEDQEEDRMLQAMFGSSKIKRTSVGVEDDNGNRVTFLEYEKNN